MCTLDFFFLMNVLFLETLFIFYLKEWKEQAAWNGPSYLQPKLSEAKDKRNRKFTRCLKKYHKSKSRIYSCFMIHPISCYSYLVSLQALKQE